MNIAPTVRYRISAAFSLVELLVVMAVITMLVSLAVPALQGVRARSLVNGGNMVADLIQQARQNSMSRGVCTALVMVNNKKEDWNNRLFMLVDLAPGAARWNPVTPWVELPEGILVDLDESRNFTSSLPVLPCALNLPPRNGESIDASKCVWQVFTPGGGLADSAGMANEPQVLRLVQGMLNGGQVQLTARENYYDVVINRFTGIAKIDRP